MNLILFGYKMCGKTYYGKLLSQRLSRPFIDTDLLLQEEYFDRKKEHLTVREIYDKLGKAGFRVLETQTLTAIQNVQKSIISVGGGMILDPKNAEMLKTLGQLVYLNLDKEILKKRMLSGQLPSYLDKNDPEGSFEKMYLERKTLYETIRAAHVEVSGKTDDQVLDELAAILNKAEYGE